MNQLLKSIAFVCLCAVAMAGCGNSHQDAADDYTRLMNHPTLDGFTEYSNRHPDQVHKILSSWYEHLVDSCQTVAQNFPGQYLPDGVTSPIIRLDKFAKDYHSTREGRLAGSHVEYFSRIVYESVRKTNTDRDWEQYERMVPVSQLLRKSNR